ncbi:MULTISPECIES: AAA family ATPase [Asticcacaulis]|uniref:AAA family ATPase n=1 Tax=Asticcacaulis TaxID=76890 RepID=UPI001AE86C53|nr:MULTISPECIES: AAA family ATPase [Asticcacaulis]MBP2157481.1 energy-coupling factor transporter ATP-binding protein EcfA2 [Asticcacaulis solisilvae]MDR6798526.1 energy-coupling factor transporter ATP-binding protein EcfA2 [Asticcacaulis sp. BE141]
MPHAPGAEPIDVFFARTVVVARQQANIAPAVYIVPVHSTHNDFGNHTLAKLLVIVGNETIFEEHTRVMFQEAPRTENILTALFDVRGNVVEAAQVEANFVSLFPDVFSYRDFVDVLGYAQALFALRRLGDAALLDIEKTDELRLSLLHSEAFHEGVLRQDEAYMSFRRGARYIRPEPFPPADQTISNFTVSAKLPCADNPYEVDFDFTSGQLFKDRAAVLIGRNGAGKTKLLASIVHAITEKGRDDGDNVVLNPYPPVSRVMVFSSVASDAYPQSIPPWEGIDYQFFGLTAAQLESGNSLLMALAACYRGGDLYVNDVGHRFHILEAVLEPLGLWGAIYLPLKPPEQGKPELLHRSVNINGHRYFQFARRSNEQRNLAVIRELDWEQDVIFLNPDLSSRQLSSGEVTMLRFAVQACSAIELNSLLLFDEPETHLHPNFISDFMTQLQELLTLTSSVAIIATHSSYVVREASRERVRHLTLVEREAVVDRPRMQTFGASVDSISQFVFGDSMRTHRYEHAIAAWVRALPVGTTIENVLEEFANELNPETLSFIAALLAAGEGSAQ